MLPPPVRERHCSSPGRPSCGPPRGGRAWLDFFFFFLWEAKREERATMEGGEARCRFFFLHFPGKSFQIFLGRVKRRDVAVPLPPPLFEDPAARRVPSA